MSGTIEDAVDFGRLREQLGGELFTPDDPSWDVARQAWNLALDQRPAAVAIPNGIEDAVAIVDFARRAGLRIAAQGTGHGGGGLGELARSILVKTSRLQGVEIDPARRRARVAAGAIWADVVGPAAEHGLVALAGSAHDVGVVGYTLGGGASFLVRKHGLAAEHVVSVELVTADGELRRVDRDTEAELFWALRGGGGGFGLVTEIEIELFEVPELYAGALFYPLERAAEVLERWRELTVDAPAELTSVGRMMRFPPLPDVPEPLRGNSFAVVEAVLLGTEADGEELLRPLRELGPDMDTMATVGPDRLLELHMDPPGPVPALGDHLMVDSIDAATVEALVGAAGEGSGSPLLGVELRHVGGSAGRSERGSEVPATIDGEFLAFAVGMLAAPELEAPIRASFERIRSALAPVAAERLCLNFTEASVAAERLYPAAALARLRAIKAGYDPDDLFQSNHEIDRGR